MKLCISDELKDIKEQLVKKGYNVVSDSNTICDVIICDLKNGDLNKANLQNNFKRDSTIIIDSGSKKTEEIEFIINNKVMNSI